MRGTVIPWTKPKQSPGGTAAVIALARDATDQLAFFESVRVDAAGNLLDPETARGVIGAAVAHLLAAQRLVSPPTTDTG